MTILVMAQKVFLFLVARTIQASTDKLPLQCMPMNRVNIPIRSLLVCIHRLHTYNCIGVLPNDSVRYLYVDCRYMSHAVLGLVWQVARSIAEQYRTNPWPAVRDWTNAGTVLYWNKWTQSGTGMIRYWTERTDARMPMPEASALMPMPS